MKVLLVYPNNSGYGRVPLGLAVLSSCLKEAGHEVSLFDTTFMHGRNADNEVRERVGTAKKVDTDKYWGTEKKDIEQELINKLNEFKPDVIAVTLIQDNYWMAMDLLKMVKESGADHIPVIAGGIFAGIISESLIRSKLVNFVVLGEGEQTLVDMLNDTDYPHGPVMQHVRPYINMNKLPYPDFSIFDDRHFWKPVDGRMKRCGYFEMVRGCVYSCTYCVNDYLNNDLYKNELCHIRSKKPERLVEEVKTLANKHNLEYILFGDENFLITPKAILRKLADLWIREVKLPFFCSARVEFMTEEKIQILKDMGCHTLAFGIEHGNEKFRRNFLRRTMSNESIKKAFALCKKYGIRTTANSMIGFPYETEELAMDTINLNKEIQPDSLSTSIFAPYIGTELHRICVRAEFIDSGIPQEISMRKSILSMPAPYLSTSRINELYEQFMEIMKK